MTTSPFYSPMLIAAVAAIEPYVVPQALVMPAIAATVAAYAPTVQQTSHGLIMPAITALATAYSPVVSSVDSQGLTIPFISALASTFAPSLTQLVAFTAHRYWRVNMLDALGSSYQVAEFEMHDTYGGSDLLSGGTASASNVVNGAAANAVDNSGATVWRTSVTTLPQWWQYDFGLGNDKAICEIVVQAGTTNPDTRSPGRFEVQYSDDNAAWTTAWQGRKRVWIGGEAKTFVRPTVSYRLNVSANDGAVGGVSQQIAEIEFLVGGADKATGGNANVQGTVGDAELAFDNSNATIWSNSSLTPPYWISYDFKDNPVFVLEQVSIVVGSTNLTRAPKDFTIEKSTDGGSNWTVLKTVTAQTGWGVNEKRTFTI